MGKRISQIAAIAAYLRDEASSLYPLTSLVALQKFGCSRLAARIYDIKNKGVVFPGDTERSHPKVQVRSIHMSRAYLGDIDVAGYWINS